MTALHSHHEGDNQVPDRVIGGPISTIPCTERVAKPRLVASRWKPDSLRPFWSARAFPKTFDRRPLSISEPLADRMACRSHVIVDRARHRTFVGCIAADNNQRHPNLLAMPIEVRRRFRVKGVVVSRVRNEQLIIVCVLVERHDTAHYRHGFLFLTKRFSRRRKNSAGSFREALQRNTARQMAGGGAAEWQPIVRARMKAGFVDDDNGGSYMQSSSRLFSEANS